MQIRSRQELEADNETLRRELEAIRGRLDEVLGPDEYLEQDARGEAEDEDLDDDDFDDDDVDDDFDFVD